MTPTTSPSIPPKEIINPSIPQKNELFSNPSLQCLHGVLINQLLHLCDTSKCAISDLPNETMASEINSNPQLKSLNPKIIENAFLHLSSVYWPTTEPRIMWGILSKGECLREDEVADKLKKNNFHIRTREEIKNAFKSLGFNITSDFELDQKIEEKPSVKIRPQAELVEIFKKEYLTTFLTLIQSSNDPWIQLWHRKDSDRLAFNNAVIQTPYIHLQAALYFESLGFSLETLKTLPQTFIKLPRDPQGNQGLVSFPDATRIPPDAYHQSLEHLASYENSAFVINLDSRPDRWKEFCAQKQIDKTSLQLIRFPAIATPGEGTGAIGCAASHLRIISNHLQANKHKNNLLIFEDDMHPTENFNRRWTDIKKELDSRQDWDIFLGGVTDGLRNSPPLIKNVLNDRLKLISIDKGFTTHFVYLRHGSLPSIVSNYRFLPFTPGQENQQISYLPIDDYYNNFRLVTALPFLATQNLGHSDTVNQVTNLEPIFQSAQNHLLNQFTSHRPNLKNDRLAPPTPQNIPAQVISSPSKPITQPPTPPLSPTPVVVAPMMNNLIDWNSSLPDPTPNSLAIIAFSYDRPLQLDAFLRSMKDNLTPTPHLTVFYHAEKPFLEAYQEVARDFPEVTFIREPLHQTIKDKSFFSSLYHRIQQLPTTHFAFAVDDQIVIEPFATVDCINALNNHKAYAFFLCLGQTIAPSAGAAFAPSVELLENDSIIRWDLQPKRQNDESSIWYYPHNLDMTIYKKDLIEKHFLLAMQNLSSPPTNPNILEAAWHQLATPTVFQQAKPATGVAFSSQKCINLPLNRVQSTFNNTHANREEWSPINLLALYKQGKRIDLSKIENLVETLKPNSQHFMIPELPLMDKTN